MLLPQFTLDTQSFTDGYGKSAHPFRPKFNGSKVL
jgi:hypothetical protein